MRGHRERWTPDGFGHRPTGDGQQISAVGDPGDVPAEFHGPLVLTVCRLLDRSHPGEVVTHPPEAIPNTCDDQFVA